MEHLPSKKTYLISGHERELWSTHGLGTIIYHNNVGFGKVHFHLEKAKNSPQFKSSSHQRLIERLSTAMFHPRFVHRYFPYSPPILGILNHVWTKQSSHIHSFDVFFLVFCLGGLVFQIFCDVMHRNPSREATISPQGKPEDVSSLTRNLVDIQDALSLPPRKLCITCHLKR